MKSKQFCSVCKDWLEMEVVPTGDGEDDDGVVWYRCPQCQGFLPKLKGTDPAAVAAAEAEVTPDSESESEAKPKPQSPPTPAEDPAPDLDEDLPWDSPADMMADRKADHDRQPSAQSPEGTADLNEEAGIPQGEPPGELPVDVDTPPAGDAPDKKAKAEEPKEPVDEFRTMLEAADQGDPKPYRPWDTYEVGDCLMHLAWEDCGVVVAKEELPGGRQVIKCYFSEAGVVRLIEKAPR